MITKKEIRGLDLKSFTDFCNYLIASLENGNIGYVREKIKKMSFLQILSFTMIVDEALNPDIKHTIKDIIRQERKFNG